MKRRWSVTAILSLIVLIVNLGGCTKIDHSMVNKAFANSSVMNSICGELQEQGTLIDEMRRIGVITDSMARNLEEQLNRIYKIAATLTKDAPTKTISTTTTTNTKTTNSSSDISEDGKTTNSTQTDTDTQTTTTTNEVVEIDIGTQYNEFIGTVLKSMTDLGGRLSGYGAAEELEDTDIAESFLKQHGNSVDAYSGYNTRVMIEKSDTNYAGIAGYLKENKVVPLNPFGLNKKGDKDLSTVTSIVDHINSLKDIEVYYVDANKVADTGKLLGLKKAISDAKSGVITNEQLAQDYFISTGEKLNFTEGKLTYEKAYAVESIDVHEHLDGISSDIAATYQMYKLQRDVLLGAFNKTSNGGDITCGVLIGQKFFVTRYPMAIFRGFERVNDSEYIPVFTHPYFLSEDKGYQTQDGEGLAGSLFTGNASSYKDTLTKGDEGTAETKTAYVDLYTGAMYYKGAIQGTVSDFIGTGTDALESSVVIRPSSAVYIVPDNKACITMVKQETKFKPTESIQIGEETETNPPITLPGTTSNIMPIVFLMDYLELVYSPGTVGTDLFTAYGRKIRLDETYILGKNALTASTGTIAYVVGDGATRSNWVSKVNYCAIELSDFMDIDGVYGKGMQPKPTSNGKDVNKTRAAVHYIPSGTEQFEQAGVVRAGDSEAERSDNLPQIAAGTGVECVMMFGAIGLDEADSQQEVELDNQEEDNKKTKVLKKAQTPLYGITLYGGIYDRALFSDWINATGNAYLAKWGTTIKELGYSNYAISNALLTEKMKGNYSFELNQDGLLNLDLNAVVQINKQNQEETRGGLLIKLRTGLMLLGMFLIIYVAILLATWALDVNFDLGLNLLEKVSLGHFIAVRSLDEMPTPDANSKTMYLDYRSLWLRCLVFAAIGLVLIIIDPVIMLVRILLGFKYVIDIIGEKVFGM